MFVWVASSHPTVPEGLGPGGAVLVPNLLSGDGNPLGARADILGTGASCCPWAGPSFPGRVVMGAALPSWAEVSFPFLGLML